MTEADMPPPERPKPRRQEGEQEHLREDAGMTKEALGGKPAEHPGEDDEQDRAERKEGDKSLVDEARDKLTGS